MSLTRNCAAVCYCYSGGGGSDPLPPPRLSPCARGRIKIVPLEKGDSREAAGGRSRHPLHLLLAKEGNKLSYPVGDLLGHAQLSQGGDIALCHQSLNSTG